MNAETLLNILCVVILLGSIPLSIIIYLIMFNIMDKRLDKKVEESRK